MITFSKIHHPQRGFFISVALVWNLFSTVYSLSAQNTINDGPFVFNEDSKWIVYVIREGNYIKRDLPNNRMAATMEVDLDLNNISFEVPLKPGLSYELTTYEMPSKLVAISDIEGDFGSFQKLLEVSGVIDKSLNWSFGAGHLVLTGDFFDRGQMVTEVLWLVYKLEWEAWRDGGQVHFILGNHEAMNLQGDFRYVHPKYQQSVDIIGKQLEDLYSENTELGQWIRTKNVVEKIGDLLFVHAGISNEVNELGLSLEEINSKARPFLDRTYYPDMQTRIIMSSRFGPLWYRGYYTGSQVPEIVDKTREIFGVDKIITGHTVVSDTISTHYGGKVINIDTPHARGKSEALLIENGTYYRVNIEGERTLLFDQRPHGYDYPKGEE